VPPKLTVEEASRMSEDAFVRHFGGLYEHSPWVAQGAWLRRPFDNLDDLREAFERTVSDAPAERRLALVRSHPELAGREAGEGTLTAESSSEQASAGLNRLSAEEAVGLAELNAAYREKFGFPMVVAVREHTTESILAQAEARLANPRDQELEYALDQIFRIARLRLRELVADSDREGNRT
jgi:OHCU decarboxylase